MIIKRLAYLLILVYGQITFGQSSNITPDRVLEIIKSSIKQQKRRTIESDSNPWLACNKDSAFFKSDTILLFGNNMNNNYVRRNCCAFIGWTFYKSRSFVQLDIDYCNEPPSLKVVKKKDFYTLKVTQEDSMTIIKTYRGENLIDSFDVIEYKEFNYSLNGEKTNELILLRHKPQPRIKI